MNEYYYIENMGNKGLWIVILSTEMSSVYWKDLEQTILRNHWANIEVHFDFLYRNGFENRFFKSRLNETSCFASRLTKCECTETYITDRFFSDNICLLEGSALTCTQRRMYIKSICHVKGR